MSLYQEYRFITIRRIIPADLSDPSKIPDSVQVAYLLELLEKESSEFRTTLYWADSMEELLPLVEPIVKALNVRFIEPEALEPTQ